MKNETRELYGGRFLNNGSRFWDENVCNMNVFDAGYKIVTPMEKGAAPYLSLEKSSSKMHVEDYMLCLGTLHVGNSETKIFENDVVDYSVKSGKRGIGSIVYCPDKFVWAVRDFKTLDYSPLFDVRLNKVLGNLYSCENLIGCDFDEAYDKLRMKIPSTTENSNLNSSSDLPVVNKAATDSTATSPAAVPEAAKSEVCGTEKKLDVFINITTNDKGTGWTYTLLSGTHIKSDEGQFHKTGDSGYYVAAAGIIALSNVKKPVPINVYTPDKTLAFLMQDDRLEKWKNNGWKKDNGTPLKNRPLLEELYENISRLGKNVTAQICDPDFKLAI